MYTQVEDTYLSQAAQAAGSTAVYDTNVKYLLADKQILARILKYTIQECRKMTIEDIMACIGEDIEVASAALDPGLSNLGRVREDKTEDSGNAHRVELMQGVIIRIRSAPGEKPSGNRLIAMLEVLLSEMNVKEKKDILEKEYGMIMQVETEGRMQSMCNLSEVFIEKGILRGIQQGALHQSRQAILDLLEDLGDIPEDILSAIRQEENVETLRIWYKAAAKAESMDNFRDKLK